VKSADKKILVSPEIERCTRRGISLKLSLARMFHLK
jgi:hypothetical protein